MPSSFGLGRSASKAARARTGSLVSDAIPEVDPNTTAGLLANRIDAWRGVVSNLEAYICAIQKVHHNLSHEYERALKVISSPLKNGDNFDQATTGVAGFFENMRSNTQALIATNVETEKTIKGSVLPIIERLAKELKAKAKEISHGAERGVKAVDKARNTTQKHIELLGQRSAGFEATGGRLDYSDDPYVLCRGVRHRLHNQVLEENNHRNDLLAVQANFASFESHVVVAIQQAMDAFTALVAGQGDKTRALHADMLAHLQRIPHDWEWRAFVRRSGDRLMNPEEPPRSAAALTFPNMDHPATKALIDGSLERKSRNKLSFGYHAAYYVVTPARFLHEFKDSDNVRADLKPELSIYLPDAVIGAPNGAKFNIKGKDRTSTFGSKITGSSEFAFKAHTAADALRWFDIIKRVCGATGPAEPDSPTEPASPGAGPAHVAFAEDAEPDDALDRRENGHADDMAPNPSPARRASTVNLQSAPHGVDGQNSAPVSRSGSRANRKPVAVSATSPTKATSAATNAAPAQRSPTGLVHA